MERVQLPLPRELRSRAGRDRDSFPGWRGHRPRAAARAAEGSGKGTRGWWGGVASAAPREAEASGSRERPQLPGRGTGEAQATPRAPACRGGTPRARGSTRAASVSPGFRCLAPLSAREGQREGRRLGPPPALAVRRGRGCRRETGGTYPERRNQFGRSLGAERKRAAAEGGRADAGRGSARSHW